MRIDPRFDLEPALGQPGFRRLRSLRSRMRPAHRWWWHVAGLVLLLLLLTGCTDGRYSGTLIFDGTHRFRAADALPGDLVLRAGSVDLSADARVGGSIYVLGGTLRADGVIAGDLVVLDGRMTLGPTARIGGDVRVGGGTTSGIELAVVEGVVVSGLSLPLAQAAPRAAAWEATLRWFVGALLLATLGGLWARQRPQTLATIAAAATGAWPAAAALGLLVLFVLPILLVMMSLTLVLIPLVLLIGLGLFLALGMGIATLGWLVGSWLQQRWPERLGPGGATFLGTLLLMGLYWLPLVGGMLLALTALLSYGALLLTRMGTRVYVPPLPPATDDLTTYRRNDFVGR